MALSKKMKQVLSRFSNYEKEVLAYRTGLSAENDENYTTHSRHDTKEKFGISEKEICELEVRFLTGIREEYTEV